MRKIALCLVLCLALSACSGPTAEEAARELVGGLELSGPVLTADVTADYGDRVYDFRLRYADGIVTILSPESIAGIEAEVKEDGVALRYDGAEVFTGTIAGISPMSALPLFVNALGESYIVDARFGMDDTLEIDFRISDEVVLTAVFDRTSELPVSAEVTENGEMRLKITFYDVKL